jgi:peptidyl-prolyl cis-trans isomerase A (cyclophilin A)
MSQATPATQIDGFQQGIPSMNFNLGNRPSLCAAVLLLAACGGGGGGGSDSATAAPPKVTLTVTNGAAVSGTIEITLAPDKAPVTVDNFLRYVKDGFYNNTVVHRVSPGFVVQGGGYRIDAARGLFAPIPLEVNKGLSNVQWSVAMARVGGQGGSATSQFFINPHVPTSPGDDGLGYAVFGTVSAGTDVVTAITTAPCAPMTLASGAAITLAPECTPQPLMIVTSAIQTQ